MTTVTDTSILSMAAALREFGYRDVTSVEIRRAVEHLTAGKKPADVIEMFVEGWLRDAGVLK